MIRMANSAGNSRQLGRTATLTTTVNRGNTGTPKSTSPDKPKTSAKAAAKQATAVRKHFVLDTNVLLHNPQSIYMFAEHEVVIPLVVIEELDTFKKNNDDNGRNARQV